MKHVTKTFSYEVKGYRELRTRDGYAFTYTLHIDGKPACTVEDEGHGGSLWVDWKPSGAKEAWGTEGSAAAAKVAAYIATLPPITDPGQEPLVIDMELWLAGLSEEFVNDRKFGRLCKTKTVYRTEKDEEGSWRVVSRAYTPDLAEELRARGAVEFWNERAQ